MKILLTEGQINRVLLNEEETKKVWYKDANIEVFSEYNNPNQIIDFESGGGYVYMTNFNEKTSMAVSIVKHSTNISFNNTSSSAIPPRKTLGLYHSFKDKKIGRFSVNFIFSYTLAGKGVVTKTINIPLTRQPKNVSAKRLNDCKQTISSSDLNVAITWWKTWLNNQATKNRFAKSFKYDKNTTEKHFVEYNKILNQIKIEYVFSDKPNGGWIAGANMSNGYNLPITINCSVADKYDKDGVNTLLIHEIQHILNAHHKFHPFKDDIFIFYRDIFSNMVTNNSASVKNKEGWKNFLISQGINKNLDSIIDSYIWRLENDKEHLQNPNEVMSSLSELRRSLNLRPDQRITTNMLNDNSSNDNVNVFICQWLFTKKKLNDFLNLSNSIAMGKPNTSDTNLA